MEFSTSDLGEVVRRARDAYRARQGHRLLPSHDRALADLGDCRTAALGGHRYHCPACDESFWVYHGCGNRACPACHGREMRAWLERRQAELLPCGYFHLVATVPRAIRRAFRADQKRMYGLFMKVVAESVTDLARDPRFVGGTPAILMVLHTWKADLDFHPHVHLLVTAGGLTDDGQHWREPKHPDFLVPVHALSKRIRHRFGEALRKRDAPRFASLPPKTWINGWNTFCKPCGHGAEAVLQYLARYVFRIALTNARLLNTDDGHVTFRYKDRTRNRWRSRRLDDCAFLDRFLQHVLPKGFHKVRYYGLWHHSKRAQQQALRLLHGTAVGTDATPPDPVPADLAARVPEAETLGARPDPASETAFRPTCPRCGCERVIHVEELPRPLRPRITPQRSASP